MQSIPVRSNERADVRHGSFFGTISLHEPLVFVWNDLWVGFVRSSKILFEGFRFFSYSSDRTYLSGFRFCFVFFRCVHAASLSAVRMSKVLGSIKAFCRESVESSLAGLRADGFASVNRGVSRLTLILC